MRNPSFTQTYTGCVFHGMNMNGHRYRKNFAHMTDSLYAKASETTQQICVNYRLKYMSLCTKTLPSSTGSSRSIKTLS